MTYDKEKNSARCKAYYEANKERLKASHKARREAKKEELRAYQKAHYEANKETIREKRRANWGKSKDTINAKKRDKFASDIPHKLYMITRGSYSRVKGRPAKKKEAVDLLGCTFEEYKEYLESKFQPGMTWENHTVEGWHIDHILPLNESEVSQEEKLKRLHYTNTQPLWAEDNYSKGNNTVYNSKD